MAEQPTDKQLILLAKSQDGDPYVWGAETHAYDSDPPAFDCSEFIQWACGHLGVIPEMPDGSWIQARHCKKHGMLIPVQQGITTAAALLFSFSSNPFTGGRPGRSHVALSQGNGRTVEARGVAYGVGEFTAVGRFNYAGLIPGLKYGGDMEYRTVKNVPDQDWARKVVDDGISRGEIVVTDDHPDDWNEPLNSGRYWTFRYRERQKARQG